MEHIVVYKDEHEKVKEHIVFDSLPRIIENVVGRGLRVGDDFYPPHRILRVYRPKPKPQPKTNNE